MQQILLTVFFIIIVAGCGSPDALDGVNIDGSPPAVVAVAPAPGDLAVIPNTPLRVQFSEKVGTAYVTLTDVHQGSETTGVIVETGEKTVTFSTGIPSLRDNTLYIVTLTSVLDLAGNKMEDYSWTFRTADPTAGPMRIKTVSPAPLDVGSPVNSTISIFFSESAASDSLINAITLSGPEGPVAGNILYSLSQRAAYFTPYILLRPGATYTATIKGVKDAAENVIPDCTWFFTTAF